MATPAMGLALPTPNVTQGIGVALPGQSWGELQNANWGIVDTHTHAPGSGSPVPTAGIAINADLTFAGFNATNLRSTRFSGITLGSLGVNDRSCLLASSGDLYFVDGAGNQVRITSGGGVAGTPGAITGLASPAAVNYTVGSKLFTFTSSSPRVAGIACGPLTIADASVDSGNGVTISAPGALAANYSLTLPTALPASLSFATLSSTGALSTFPGIGIAGSNLTLPGQLAGPGLGGALTGANSTPTSIAPGTGWTVDKPISWWKDVTGMVHMKGSVNNNTGSTQTGFATPFFFPVGSRPAASTRDFLAPSDNLLSTCIVEVHADGFLGFPNGMANGTGVIFDSVAFLAEQ